jgi:hypothetical protein
MTTTRTASTVSAAPSTRRTWSGRRTALLVAGGLLAVFSVGSLAGGGAALVTAQQRGDDGFITGSPGRFTTDTYAIATPSVNVDAAGPDAAYVEDLVGKIRIQVQSVSPGTSLFVGVGRADDVARYLDRVTYDKVDQFDTGPFEVDYKRHAGGQPATAPAAQTFWVASDTGTGSRNLIWPVTSGDWTVVIMNTDASAGIEADVTAGVTLPILRPIAITALVVGGLLLPAAAVLIIATFASRRRRPTIATRSV